ncbi:saccharopine dehydrogenase family protein [Brevibacillus sp. SYSU BS000544]|uniref:saccharopine dehydrogenase family protein n=1 Tax=Brevibacillus sp. SYSU BS000544 TaxID=3416443 RepID=UPI003CE48601
MKEHIVVVGGYGHVGQTICRELAEIYPGKVFAAGRSLERAEQFSLSSGGKVKPMQLDIREPVHPDVWNSVKLIIMCLDQENPAFVQSCFETGTHYIDISANSSFLSQVKSLHSIASANHSTAVLSIGLAPGLTNLLALHATRLMDQTELIDISIMLGLGDQHGKAAIEWTIDNLSTSFEVVANGSKVAVASFTDGKATYFGSNLGHRKAYRFNFSDQHSIPETLGIPSVSTRLCFDSPVMTQLLAWLRASGVFRLLKAKPFRKAAVQSFGKLRFGKEMFALKIDARGKKNGKDVFIECFAQGKNEAIITAKVAAAVADVVYRSNLPHGIYHIDQLFDLERVMPLLEQVVKINTVMNGNSS